MLIAILGDAHIGVRNESQIFHRYYARFYQQLFFPTLRARGIKHVIQTGDLFDRRKFVNYKTLRDSHKYLFDEFTKGDLHLTTYLGNHDVYYTNTLEVNSPTLLLGDYISAGQINVITEPTLLSLDGEIIGDVIPWICADNQQRIKQFITDSKQTLCFGHFEISGFSMEKGSVCHDGMNRNDLSRYDMVISGHFHHRSTDGQITYVGTPYEMTWSDWDDQRGFHILDTETRELEFIPNTDSMFHKVIYDDTNETMESIDNKDYNEYHQKYIKVVVQCKQSLVLFDRFMGHFYNAQPADLAVVEDFTEYNTLTDLMSGAIDQGETTPMLLDRYVDSIEVNGMDKTKMKSIMRNIHNQAQALEGA